MEITREIINNSEIRSRLYEKFNSLRSRLTTSKLKTILLVSLVSFTSLLVRQTLQVQHSCNPMIHWSGDLPAECQVALKTSFDNFDDFSALEKQSVNNNLEDDDFDFQTKREFKTPKQQPSIAQNTVKPQSDEIINSPKATEPETIQTISQSELEERSDSVGQFVNEHSNDIVGAVAGVAGGVATVAAASATAAFSIPVAGAVAIGMGIWFLIRSAL